MTKSSATGGAVVSTLVVLKPRRTDEKVETIAHEKGKPPLHGVRGSFHHTLGENDDH